LVVVLFSFFSLCMDSGHKSLQVHYIYCFDLSKAKREY
jgi:hypothetical protein